MAFIQTDSQWRSGQSLYPSIVNELCHDGADSWPNRLLGVG